MTDFDLSLEFGDDDFVKASARVVRSSKKMNESLKQVVATLKDMNNELSMVKSTKITTQIGNIKKSVDGLNNTFKKLDTTPLTKLNEGIQDALGEANDTIADGVDSPATRNRLRTSVRNIGNFLQTSLRTTFRGIRIGASAVGGLTSSVASAVGNALRDGVRRAGTIALNAIRDLDTRIINGIRGIADNLRTRGRDLLVNGFVATTVGLGTIGASVAPIGGAINVASQFESQFADVIRTIDLTALSADEAGVFLQGLEDDIRNLATAPDSLVSGLDNAQAQLTEIASIGGQLGIAQDDILEFTEAIANLTIATPLDAQSASFGVARIGAIAQSTEFTEISSAIVNLGNNFATTEQNVIDFAQRLTGAGTSAGFAIPEILALGASASAVGIEAEAGGTALTQVLTEISTAVANGGQDLQNFASIAGQSGQDFAEVWRNNPVQALDEFIQGIGDLDNEARISALDELGLDGVRTSLVLTNLAGASGLLGDALEVANEGFYEFDASAQEASIRAGLASSATARLRNVLRDIGISVGQLFLPVFTRATNTLSNFLLVVNRLIRNNPRFARTLITIGSAMGVIAGALITIGGLQSIFGGLLLTGASSLVGVLATMVGLLFNPVGLIVGFGLVATAGLAISTAFLAFRDIRDNIGGAGDAFDRFTTSVGELFSVISDLAGGVLDLVANLFNLGDAGERGFSPITSALNFVSTLVDSVTIRLRQLSDFLTIFNSLADGGSVFDIFTTGVEVDIDGDDAQDTVDALLDGLTQVGKLGEGDGGGRGGVFSPVQLAEGVLQDRLLNAGQVADPTATLGGFETSPLFQRLFGDDPTAVDRARETIQNIRSDLDDVDEGADLVAEGFRTIVSGEFTTGFQQVGEGIQGIASGLSDAFSSFVDGTTLGSQSAGTQSLLSSGLLPEADAQALQESSSQGIVGSIVDSVTNADFSGISDVIGDNTFDAVKIGLGLASVLLGGVPALVAGLTAVVLTAIENDFLGIGTALESTGIPQAISDAISGLFSSADAVIPEQGIFDGQLLSEEGLVPTNIGEQQSGLESALGFVTTIVDELTSPTLTNGIDAIRENVVPGIQSVFDGINGFLSNIFDGGEDRTANLTSIVDAIGNIIGFIVELGAISVGGFLDTLGDTLPIVGDTIGNIIDLVGNLIQGDFGGALDSVGDIVGNAIDLITTLVSGSFETGANFIGKVLGIDELPEKIELAFLRVRSSILGFFADITNDPAIQGIFEGLGIDISGFNNNLRQQVRDTNLEINAIEFGNDVQSTLTDLNNGVDVPIDLSSDATGLDIGTLQDVIRDELNAEGFELLLTEAFAQGESIAPLIPLIPEFGLENDEDIVAIIDTLITDNIGIGDGQELIDQAIELGIPVDPFLVARQGEVETAIADFSEALVLGDTIGIAQSLDIILDNPNIELPADLNFTDLINDTLAPAFDEALETGDTETITATLPVLIELGADGADGADAFANLQNNILTILQDPDLFSTADIDALSVALPLLVEAGDAEFDTSVSEALNELSFDSELSTDALQLLIPIAPEFNFVDDPTQGTVDLATSGLLPEADTIALASEFEGIGNDIMDGLAVGIESNTGATGASADAVQAVLDEMRSTAGVQSPSTVTAEIGNELVNGLVLGLSENQGAFATALTSLIAPVESLPTIVAPAIDNVNQSMLSLVQTANQTASGFGQAVTTMVSDVNQLVGVASSLEGAFSQISTGVSGGVNIDISTGASGGISGRAFGGNIRAGGIYEVLEGGLPFETVTVGNRTYLLSNQDGFVGSPLSASALQSPVVPPVVNNNGGGFSASSQNNVSVVVNIDNLGDGVTQSDSNQLVELITTQVEQRLQDANDVTVNDRLLEEGLL